MGSSPGVEVAVLVYRHLMEDLEMLKTPSTLKWLAEKRARVAGKLEPQERLLQQVESKVVKLRDDLAALDHALFLFDSSVDATGIETISAWAGNYGTRGSLMDYLAFEVETSSPAPVSTRELTLRVVERFALVFDTPELRARWKRNSLLRALNKLAAAGKLEVVPGTSPPQMNAWRWTQPKSLTLAELRAASALVEAAAANELADAEA